MLKNTAGQKIQLFAFDVTTGLPKTGDAANLTAYVSKDHGAVTVLGDTSATEMDATNAKGVYLFDLTQGETNADEETFTAKSTTANISITPRFVTTTTAATAPLDAAGTRAAIGLASANLDTQIATLATSAGLTSAVAPLATAAGVTSAVAPLATSAGLTAAVAPLATTAGQITIVSAISTVDGKVDGVAAQTDQLAFGASGAVDANITHVIADPVQTNGSSLTNWGGAS